MSKFISLILMMAFAFTLPLQAQDEVVMQDLLDLEANYLEVEEDIKEQLSELENKLEAGYGGPALTNDLKIIAESVEVLERRLKGYASELIELQKLLKYNPIKPFKITVRKGAKDAVPLMKDAEVGDDIFFTTDITYPQLNEGETTALNWSIILPSGDRSEIMYKSEPIKPNGAQAVHSFGVKTGDLGFGTYTVQLEHVNVDNPAQKQFGTASFTLAEKAQLTEVEIVRLVVDDNRSGEVHHDVLDADATPFMFTYYNVPEGLSGVLANYKVRDLTDRKTIYEREGGRKTKPDMDTQRVGVVLDPEAIIMKVGHEYRFDVSLKYNVREPGATKQKLKTVKDSVTFFYGEEPLRVELDGLIATHVAGDGRFRGKMPKAQSLELGSWYKATRPVEEMNVIVRLVNHESNEVVSEQAFAHVNSKEKPREQFVVSFNTELMTEGARYRNEVEVSVEGFDEPVTRKSTFIYAEIPEPRMKDFVKVEGKISTPGAGSSDVSEKTNALKLDSTVKFDAAPVYPKGLTGSLFWMVSGGGPRKDIALDGSNNDWSFNFSPKAAGSRGSYSVALRHKPAGRARVQTVYSASFNVALPFYATTFGEDKPIIEKSIKDASKDVLVPWHGYAWLRDTVGIEVRASNFPVKLNVSVKATLEETGQVLFTEKKSLSLDAKKNEKLEWKLDQPALKFDLESIYPNIDFERDFKKTIITEFTIDDGAGYSKQEKITTTQWLYRLHSERNFKKGPGTEENPLTHTVIPPAVMRGPYESLYKGASYKYIDGLNRYYRPDDLEEWVKTVGVEKYNETDEANHYQKKVPVLIMIEDAEGKQAAVFWSESNHRAFIHKPPPEDDDDN